MPKFKDITGHRFGHLTVIGVGEKTKAGKNRWICKCDCGGLALPQTSDLNRGQKYCKECAKGRPTHRLSHLPEFAVWANMKQRCRNKKSTSYFRYGARGIDYDNRWDNFELFLEDMGKRPDKSYTLERINNNGNYCKENCKWATRKEQARNYRFNHNLEFNGQTKCISEWGEIYGLKHDTIAGRLELGWSVEKALTTQVKQHRKIDLNGELLPIKTVEKLLGMGSGTISYRLKSGYSEYDAIHTPLKNKL